MAATSPSNGSAAPVRLLQPDVLSRLGNLELLARSVVDGVLTGLHRSPDFGFSQEFAEYRSYNEGDDLRFVDWNVYARTDRMYVKRFRGDTNTALTLLVDASGSMGYKSGGTGSVSKFDYARYLAASLAYIASKQHDAIGTIIFDDTVREVVPPSSRPDALSRVFATLEKQEASESTNVEAALEALHPMSHRRGLIAVLSDFYTEPERFLKSLQPLTHRRQDIVLFQILDPAELAPKFDNVVALRNLEDGEQMDVDPNWLNEHYRNRISEHCATLKKLAQGSGADYVQLPTDQPLDMALQRYLLFRQRKL